MSTIYVDSTLVKSLSVFALISLAYDGWLRDKMFSILSYNRIYRF